MGITGIRVQLITESPQHLLVKYVFDNSLTWRKIHPNDILVGVNYQLFTIAHNNSYGMDKFEPDGPILKFATALGSCQAESGKFGTHYPRSATTV